jgi:hypothetical protein
MNPFPNSFYRHRARVFVVLIVLSFLAYFIIRWIPS